VYVIWDKVRITLTAEDDRIDVGSKASIKKDAIYLYDLTPYDGTIILDTDLRQTEVGKYTYRVSSIANDTYGISVFEGNTVSVIFDRVEVNLTSIDNRIDVGSKAPIIWTGIYRYDGAPFQGDVNLNNSLVKLDIGSCSYRVNSVRDELYGLTIFTSNEVSIIFDQVEITISISSERVEAGRTAEITWRGIYGFDGSTFKGTVTLNDSATKQDVGNFGYTVKGISDPSYGLSAFSSNSVQVIFDRIWAEYDLETLTPTELRVKVKVLYESDGKPVENAKVTANDVEGISLGGGKYQVTISTISPIVVINTVVVKSGFTPIIKEITAYLYGNLGLDVGTILLAITALVIMTKKRRIKGQTRTPERQPSNLN
jgi:hypothetical protein